MTRSNRRTTSKTLLLVLAVALITAMIQSVSSANINLTLNTTKQTYAIGDKGSIWGNVTFPVGQGEELILDALVAIEVDNPKGEPVILRTRTTGALPPSTGVFIQSLTTCDQVGNPLYTFTRGTLCYFKMSLQNTGTSRYVEITLNIFDAKNIAYEAFIAFKGLLFNGTTSYLISDPIPQDISPGNATAYINVFTSLPRTGGFALCLEEKTSFTIIDGTSPPLPSEAQPPSGFYNVTFLIDNYQTTRKFRPGNYSVYATCKYQTDTANSSKTFEIILTGDINRDGIVDIYDAILLANAYGAAPGNPRWNTNADINDDDLIDIYDAIILANNFGRKA